MILRREGFQRVYDLTERVLPDGLLEQLPTPEEQQRFFVSNSLRALGIATPRWVADYFRTGGRPHVPATRAARELDAMANEGFAVPIQITGFEEPAWIDPALVPRLAAFRAGRQRPTLTTVLSPFDNLIWHRGRTQTLFGFDYRLESYTPADKRQYGYYTLPVLHRGRLVGRIDPVYRRKSRILTLRNVHLEPGVRVTDRLITALGRSLREYVSFLGGGEIQILAADPPTLVPRIVAETQRLSRPSTRG
jgi:uncharacterized protein YcaQ